MDTPNTGFELLDVHEVASILRCHVNWVRDACRSGTIPAVKIAGAWRVQRRTLEQWIAQGEKGG